MATSQYKEIEDFFVGVSNLIERQLLDKVQNRLVINRKFKEGKKLIDQLEEDDEEQFGSFRYKFHTVHAAYLKTIGEVDNASKQEKLAKKFEKYKKFSEEMDTYKNMSVLFPGATLGDINQNPVENPKENSTQDPIEEHLNSIQNVLEDKVVEDIRKVFKQFDNIPETFESYQNMVNSETSLLKVVNNFINDVLISNDDEKRQVLKSLESLKLLAVEISYSKRISFIQSVLNSPDKREILYSNITFTEEGINKRFRDLALHFHPDKTSQTYTPYQLQSKDKHLGVDLFRFIQEYKEDLLSKLDTVSKEEGRLTFHEKKGNELWKIAIDYRNASRGQLDRLKLLKEEDIRNDERDELERWSGSYGKLAYHEYQAACKIADKAKDLKKQVKLRGSMALCLHISKNFLEAQLYALSAILLLLYKSPKVTQKDLAEAKKIFDKVKGGDGTDDTVKLSTEINLRDNSDNSFALVRMDQEFSFIKKKAFQNSINDDIAKLGNELIFNPDRSLVCYQANKEEILHAKNRAKTFKTAGVTGMGAGTVVGGGIAVGAALNIYNAVFVVGVATVGGPLMLLGGLATFGLGIWSGRCLWKKGTDLYREPEIREKLNQIMIDAIKAYDEGEHQNFLDALSKEYETNTSLLKFKKPDDVINPADIIDKLSAHGFRSDGIAYLLNLLGEVLNGGKLEVKGKTKKDLRAIAVIVFNAVLNEKLKAEAKKLDSRIHELRNESFLSRVRKVTDFIFLNEYSDIAQEYKDDAHEMPFQSRLEEICNIARINLAIIDIIDAGPEEIKRAVETIKDIRDSVSSNYQFVGTVKWRLEILEDFLWVINGEELKEEPPKASLVTLFLEINQDSYLNYLNDKLKQASSKQEELHLYSSIAAYHEQLAEQKDKVSQLESLCHWQAAQKNYESAIKLDPKNLDTVLGSAKCLLKISNYSRIIKLAITSPGLTSLSDYWFFCSIAYCKQVDYKKADECIIEALRINPGNKLAGKQKDLLRKLMIKGNSTIDYRIKSYAKEKFSIEFQTGCLKNSHSENRPTYNILSIDGGGIRGVLPALWLSEIEHRAHKPISHLFNMMAGTSTGGIIAAGLSAPFWEKVIDGEDSYRYDYSDIKPRVSAAELLNLYQTQAKDLILAKNKKEQLLDYFDKIRLDKALTELVIPAVNSKQPYLFTRYDARIDASKNDTFFDTLMATTASPGFSSTFNIKNKGDFLDGGICLNNPAMTAYTEAIRYKVASEKIFVLSMGTGSYIPDPSNPGLCWGQLFWKRNFYVALPAQEINTDSQMYNLLGNNYQRWQVKLGKTIGFSDYNTVPYLLELGHQYIEELDASDANPINKLVESFEING